MKHQRKTDDLQGIGLLIIGLNGLEEQIEDKSCGTVGSTLVRGDDFQWPKVARGKWGWQMKLVTCASAAQDQNAAVSANCCSQVNRIGHNLFIFSSYTCPDVEAADGAWYKDCEGVQGLGFQVQLP
ncbi:hypothetical protein EV1_001319 [Malus domestica]